MTSYLPFSIVPGSHSEEGVGGKSVDDEPFEVEPFELGGSCIESEERGIWDERPDDGDAIVEEEDWWWSWLSVNKVGKREGGSFVHLEFCDSVGLAKGESIMLEFFPSADGVNVIEPADVMRRWDEEEVLVGVDVVVVVIERG